MKNYLKSPRTKKSLLIAGILILSFTIVVTAASLSLVIINALSDRTQFDLYTIIFMVLTALLFIVSFAVALTSYIVAQKLHILVENLSKVAGGDFSAEITYRRGDMFGQVYKNFNIMTRELNSTKTLRDDFVRDFSHEVKTPLFSVQGFANLLLEGGLTEEEQKKFLKIIADESGRLLKLAEGVLTLSGLENTQLLGETSNLRLDREITDCIIMSEREWEQKNIEVTSDMAPLNVTGSAESLKQVWLNILSNAIKFTPEGGKIEVSLKKEGNYAVAVFKDSGVGIPQEDLPHIFGKYYRGAYAAGKEGNGLGLAVCDRICRLSGGEISAESDGKNGSSFIVKLPLGAK